MTPIVISYDLGLKGDYNGLYRFLDKYEAMECGSNLAVFAKEFSSQEFETIYTELKLQIQEMVQIDSNDRLYMIVKDSDNKMKGQFLFGSRKKAPWEGFYTKNENQTDVF